MGALGATERCAEGDCLGDTSVAAELLHVPARDDAAETVPDEVNAATDRDPLDERGQAPRDPIDADAGRVGEARHLRAGGCGEGALHRSPNACAREEAVDEHDDVVLVAGLVGYERA